MSTFLNPDSIPGFAEAPTGKVLGKGESGIIWKDAGGGGGGEIFWVNATPSSTPHWTDYGSQEYSVTIDSTYESIAAAIEDGKYDVKCRCEDSILNLSHIDETNSAITFENDIFLQGRSYRMVVQIEPDSATYIIPPRALVTRDDSASSNEITLPFIYGESQYHFASVDSPTLLVDIMLAFPGAGFASSLIENTGGSPVDVIINSVYTFDLATYDEVPIPAQVPEDGITIPVGCAVELSVFFAGDRAVITASPALSSGADYFCVTAGYKGASVNIGTDSTFPPMWYSLDSPGNWMPYRNKQEITLAGSSQGAGHDGQKVYFCGECPAGHPEWNLECVGVIKVSGDITTLLTKNGTNDISSWDSIFDGFFERQEVVDASGLNLRATTLSRGCYSSMFGMCDQLTAAPAIKSLPTATDCYYCMFAFCDGLHDVHIDESVVGNWNTSNSRNWLDTQSGTGTVYASANLNIATDTTSGIPSGWTKSTY